MPSYYRHSGMSQPASVDAHEKPSSTDALLHDSSLPHDQNDLEAGNITGASMTEPNRADASEMKFADEVDLDGTTTSAAAKNKRCTCIWIWVLAAATATVVISLIVVLSVKLQPAVAQPQKTPAGRSYPLLLGGKDRQRELATDPDGNTGGGGGDDPAKAVLISDEIAEAANKKRKAAEEERDAAEEKRDAAEEKRADAEKRRLQAEKEKEQAKKGAESAREAAQAALEEAAEAKHKAVDAEQEAARAQREAEEAARRVASAENSREEALVDAGLARSEAERVAAEAALERADAEVARAKATASERARTVAEAGRAGAEAASEAAASAREAAEAAQAQAEAAREEAEAAQAGAEREAAVAQEAREVEARRATEAKGEKDSARADAEAARAEAEAARAEAEAARAEAGAAEAMRAQAEANRAQADAARFRAAAAEAEARRAAADAEEARERALRRTSEAQTAQTTAQTDADRAVGEAQKAEKAAEALAAEAVSDREQARMEAEDAKGHAEAARSKADSAVAEAWRLRAVADKGREQAEQLVIEAENVKERALLEAQSARADADRAITEAQKQADSKAEELARMMKERRAADAAAAEAKKRLQVRTVLSGIYANIAQADEVKKGDGLRVLGTGQAEQDAAAADSRAATAAGTAGTAAAEVRENAIANGAQLNEETADGPTGAYLKSSTPEMRRVAVLTNVFEQRSKAGGADNLRGARAVGTGAAQGSTVTAGGGGVSKGQVGGAAVWTRKSPISVSEVAVQTGNIVEEQTEDRAADPPTAATSGGKGSGKGMEGPGKGTKGPGKGKGKGSDAEPKEEGKSPRAEDATASKPESKKGAGKGKGGTKGGPPPKSKASAGPPPTAKGKAKAVDAIPQSLPGVMRKNPSMQLPWKPIQIIQMNLKTDSPEPDSPEGDSTEPDSPEGDSTEPGAIWKLALQVEKQRSYEDREREADMVQTMFAARPGVVLGKAKAPGSTGGEEVKVEANEMGKGTNKKKMLTTSADSALFSIPTGAAQNFLVALNSIRAGVIERNNSNAKLALAPEHTSATDGSGIPSLSDEEREAPSSSSASPAACEGPAASDEETTSAVCAGTGTGAVATASQLSQKTRTATEILRTAIEELRVSAAGSEAWEYLAKFSLQESWRNGMTTGKKLREHFFEKSLEPPPPADGSKDEEKGENHQKWPRLDAGEWGLFVQQVQEALGVDRETEPGASISRQWEFWGMQILEARDGEIETQKSAAAASEDENSEKQSLVDAEAEGGLRFHLTPPAAKQKNKTVAKVVEEAIADFTTRGYPPLEPAMATVFYRMKRAQFADIADDLAQWFAELTEVENFESKVNFLATVAATGAQVDEVVEEGSGTSAAPSADWKNDLKLAESVGEAAKALWESGRSGGALLKALRAVLRIGNALNVGTRLAGAAAFDLELLGKLSETKVNPKQAEKLIAEMKKAEEEAEKKKEGLEKERGAGDDEELAAGAAASSAAASNAAASAVAAVEAEGVNVAVKKPKPPVQLVVLTNTNVADVVVQLIDENAVNELLAMRRLVQPGAQATGKLGKGLETFFEELRGQVQALRRSGVSSPIAENVLNRWTQWAAENEAAGKAAVSTANSEIDRLRVALCATKLEYDYSTILSFFKSFFDALDAAKKKLRDARLKKHSGKKPLAKNPLAEKKRLEAHLAQVNKYEEARKGFTRASK